MNNYLLHPFIYPSIIYLSTQPLSIYPSIHPPVHSSIYPLIHLPTHHPSIHPLDHHLLTLPVGARAAHTAEQRTDRRAQLSQCSGGGRRAERSRGSVQCVWHWWGFRPGALLFSVSAKSSLMKGHLSKGLKEAWAGARWRPVG